MSESTVNPPRLARYVVELSTPGRGWSDIQSIGVRARGACEELRKSGTAVRFLRSVFVPEDGSCFLLFEAASAEDAGLAAARAELGVESVVEAVRP